MTRQILTDDQNARLRAVVRNELLPKHGSQSALAPVLGIKQGALSQFLGGKTGASLSLAQSIADAAGVRLASILVPDDPVLKEAADDVRRAMKSVRRALSWMKTDHAAEGWLVERDVEAFLDARGLLSHKIVELKIRMLRPAWEIEDIKIRASSAYREPPELLKFLGIGVGRPAELDAARELEAAPAADADLLAEAEALLDSASAEFKAELAFFANRFRDKTLEPAPSDAEKAGPK